MVALDPWKRGPEILNGRDKKEPSGDGLKLKVSVGIHNFKSVLMYAYICLHPHVCIEVSIFVAMCRHITLLKFPGSKDIKRASGMPSNPDLGLSYHFPLKRARAH